MSGKRGLVMGVANDHSIAWGIACALSAHGAELAFTYQGEALGKRVHPLAMSINSSLVLPCDVEDLASVDAVFVALSQAWGTPGFCSSLHRLFRPKRTEGPLCRDLPRELRSHDGDIGVFLHGNRQARRGADAERRRDADAHVRRGDAGHAELQRHGRRQGGPGGERAISRRGLRTGGYSKSTPSRPVQFARWPAPASPTRASCSTSSATTRPCDARLRSRMSAAPRFTCFPTWPRASPAKFISSIRDIM